jgi:hypothetical protein
MKKNSSQKPTQGNPPTVEMEHQIALFRWVLDEIAKGHTSLENLGAIPNGMRQLRWPCLRKTPWLGARAGMPDIYHLLPRGDYCGLFIELKGFGSYGVTDLQAKCHERLRKNGYRVEGCRGWEDAKEAILRYERLGGKK